jgi:hypothetical protein
MSDQFNRQQLLNKHPQSSKIESAAYGNTMFLSARNKKKEFNGDVSVTNQFGSDCNRILHYCPMILVDRDVPVR